MLRRSSSASTAILGALMLAATLASPVSAQVRPPAYGEGPGATSGDAPVRELPNTGSGPGDTAEGVSLDPLALVLLGAGSAGAVGVMARRRRSAHHHKR
jgi:hypothetical protein